MYGNQYYKVMLLCPFTDYSYWDQPALVQRNFANCSYDTLYPCSKSSLCHFLFPVSFSFFLYYSILHSSRIVLVSFVVLSSPVLFHIMCALLQPWTCILHLLFPCFTSTWILSFSFALRNRHGSCVMKYPTMGKSVQGNCIFASTFSMIFKHLALARKCSDLF